MIFSSLPKELKDKIFNYAFGKCNLCKKYMHYSNVINNCRIFEYKNVFQDDYWNKEEMLNFSLICKTCVKEFHGKIIVNLKDNTYMWIKDYDKDKQFK